MIKKLYSKKRRLFTLETNLIEEYSEERIAEFLKEDRLDKETSKKTGEGFLKKDAQDKLRL